MLKISFLLPLILGVWEIQGEKGIFLLILFCYGDL